MAQKRKALISTVTRPTRAVVIAKRPNTELNCGAKSKKETDEISLLNDLLCHENLEFSSCSGTAETLGANECNPRQENSCSRFLELLGTDGAICQSNFCIATNHLRPLLPVSSSTTPLLPNSTPVPQQDFQLGEEKDYPFQSTYFWDFLDCRLAHSSYNSDSIDRSVIVESCPSNCVQCHHNEAVNDALGVFGHGFNYVPETEHHDRVKEIEFRESMEILLARQNSSHCRPLKLYADKQFATKKMPTNWQALRRKSTQWIIQVVKHLQLTISIAAQAVGYLDRYLSTTTLSQDEGSCIDINLVAAACFWVALKLEDSRAPDVLAIQNMFRMTCNEERICNVEATVLRALGWRMLGVTAVDFMEAFIEMLPAWGLPGHLLKSVDNRTQEIMEGVLSEVVFVEYEASTICIGVLQSVLEEIVPLQADSILSSMQKILPFDMEAARECHKALGDLVIDPICVCEVPSPDRVGAVSITLGKL